MSNPDLRISDYGHFDEKEGCFVITAEPPRKWRNIHYNRWGNHEYYAEATHIGDGMGRYTDAEGNVIRTVGYDCKYLYVRDDESGTLFNPAGMPCPTPVEGRRIEIHPSKTVIASSCLGLKVRHRIFVPADATAEVWTLDIQNTTAKPRRLSVFAYTAFDLGGCTRNGEGFHGDNYSEIHPDLAAVLVVNRHRMVPIPHRIGFLAAQSDYFAACGMRDRFTRADYSLAAPKPMFGWDCDNAAGYVWNPAAAVQCKITVPAHGAHRLDFLIGITTGPEDVARLRRRFTPAEIDCAAESQARTERERAAAYHVNTGAANANRDAMFNIFIKKQVYSYIMDKSGVRDNLQNANGLVLTDPATARANILKCLGVQKADGSCLHSWRPLNRHQYSDKPAWMLQTVPWYIKETGDQSILEENIPFFESKETGSVWEHMLRAYRFLSTDLGKRGLCDQHFADWNDNLEKTELTGERESVMVSQQLCAGLLETGALAERIGQTAVRDECAALHKKMADTINRAAWDGEWYVRTICEDGYCLGSSKNPEARIFVNTQSWAVFGRIADRERLLQCMRSVDKFIEKPEGFAIADPPCMTFDQRVGRLTAVMPGYVENGGCYNHAAGFKCVADCMLGRAEEAFRTLCKVAPDGPELPVSVSGAEPFAFGNHYSRVPSGRGTGGYAWRTGTASWFTVALLEYILGARRGYDGLVIDPCLSKTVPEAALVRRFRGTQYTIHLDNREGRCTGAREIRLDGEILKGNVLPITGKPAHRVDVIL